MALLKEQAYKKLVEYLKTLESICVAFSGGVDSAFLLKVCKEVLGDNVLAITITSSMCPQRELKEAISLAQTIGVKHVLLEAEEYSIPEFVENGKERCYFCKKAIFTKVCEVARLQGINQVVDGSNADDIKDYRPGMRALEELGVGSPLKEAGLTKQNIRDFSKALHLETWEKPSMACLASRIPYGKEITKEKLMKVEKAEEYLYCRGFKQFRVRYYDEIAKIEVLPEDMYRLLEETFRLALVNYFKTLGFSYITLDIEGFRSGSMNETLKK